MFSIFCPDLARNNTSTVMSTLGVSKTPRGSQSAGMWFKNGRTSLWFSSFSQEMCLSELSGLTPFRVLTSRGPVNQGMEFQTGTLPGTGLIWIYNNTATFLKRGFSTLAVCFFSSSSTGATSSSDHGSLCFCIFHKSSLTELLSTD